MPNFIYVLSYCAKFAVKVDFSSGSWKELPNWVKITHPSAHLLQFVRKIFLEQVLKKKFTTYFTI